nr:MAG TPA: hypothetical protein [Caudoviricetes sp.]
MLALYAGPYTKEDFAYLVNVLAKSDSSTSCSSSCEACKHRRACADVQRLLKYSRSKLNESTEEERTHV